MNKTITIYELLGLVKDGKAPKTIKYDGDKYTYNDCKDYEIDSSNYNLFETTTATFILNDTVEIIEDNDKLEKMEHFDLFDFFTGYEYGGTDKGLLKDLEMNFQHINNELAYLIDHINKIEERLDEK